MLASLLAIPFVAGNATAESGPLSGQVQMNAHTHSAGTLLFPAQRLPYNFTVGDTFSYSSRLCSARAPFNDLGLNFIPDYPGVDDDADHTAPVRHRVEGTVTSVSGDRGTIQGKITTVLCRPSATTQVATANAIISYYEVQFTLVPDNDLLLNGGFQISPTESTGTFRDMQGGGHMEGRLTCLGHQSDPAQPSCAQLGQFTDLIIHSGDPTLPAGQLPPGLIGTFYDPTVGPVV